MPTLNVCVQIKNKMNKKMNKKNQKIYKKYKYFSSFQKLCQYNIDKASEKKRNICTFCKFFGFFYSFMYIYSGP